MKKNDKTEVINGKNETPAGFYEDIENLVSLFGDTWSQGENAVLASACTFRKAVVLFGWDRAFKRFNERFGQIGKYNFKLLDDIGAGVCDGRVWFLPRYMHGVRNMSRSAQAELLNTRAVSIYKFASEKPATIELGSVNQSDWRVAFDREKCRLRSTEEQIKYIRAKKYEFRNRTPWHVGKGKVVFEAACTVTRKQLEELIDLLQ